MPITEEEFEDKGDALEHSEAIKRWGELGKKLGFKVRYLDREETKGTLVDVIWWDDFNGKMPNPKFWTPAVAIEVETVHQRKAYKADIYGFNTLKPKLGIIHMVDSQLIKRYNKKYFETTKKTVQKYIDMGANGRVVIALDKDLEELEKS